MRHPLRVSPAARAARTQKGPTARPDSLVPTRHEQSALCAERRGLPDVDLRGSLTRGLPWTDRHHGSDRLPPGSREGGEVVSTQLVGDDKGTSRVGNCGTDNQPRPLYLRQRAAPSRCGRTSRPFVFDQPARPRRRPIGVDPRSMVGSMAVDRTCMTRARYRSAASSIVSSPACRMRSSTAVLSAPYCSTPVLTHHVDPH